MTPLGSAGVRARDWIRVQLRQSRAFRTAIAELLELERLSPEALARHQAARLADQITHAARYVPYYRRLFAASGFNPADFRDLSQLRRLPLLDKSAIKARPADFRSERQGLTFRGYTSGTTGSPLVVYRDLDGIVREHEATIQCESAPGKGTRFELRFVAAPDSTAASPQRQSAGI